MGNSQIFTWKNGRGPITGGAINLSDVSYVEPFRQSSGSGLRVCFKSNPQHLVVFQMDDSDAGRFLEFALFASMDAEERRSIRFHS